MAAAGIEGDTLTIRGARQGVTAVTVTASDPDGLSASQNVAVTVVNQPPAVADSIPPQTFVAGERVTFDLPGYFGDPDGDVLAYTAASGDTAVAAAGVMGDTLTIRGVRQGATAVTVTASDPDGLSASQNVAVDVEANPDRAILEALYRSTGGNSGYWRNHANWLTDASLQDWFGVSADTLERVTGLRLGNNDLTGPIPPELGKLGSLASLYLNGNNLTGPVPPELGKLASLEYLYLNANSLTGPIPPELGKLTNLWLNLDPNAGLCVPGIQSFSTHRGSFTWCNETDIRALEALYEAAGGSEWQSDEGWLDGAALGGWYGVDADSLGRVTELDLADNDLAGVLPTGMGDLEELRTLKIERNSGLGGRLPLSLARLSALDVLKYARTELCAPVDKAFREWLDGLETHVGTGVDCDALTDRDMLVALYKATGGDSWKQNTNWLTDASLQDWFGVSVDTLERVTRLRLYGNDLTGPIPPELGDLAALERLLLYDNSLTGPIPPELGKLGSLAGLNLGSNRLTGEIPPEFSELADLEELLLYDNSLTGEIPPEFGDLAALERLLLSGNDLTGPIPPELGKLGSLAGLNLGSNRLTGEIPPEFSELADLEELLLYDNSLTGEIPPELGDLADLEELLLYDNSLTGPVPPELGKLASLRYLYLNANSLTDPIPPELGKLGSLASLNLADNSLTGPIPPELGKLTNLWLNLDPNAGLCVPGIQSFSTHRGSFTWCNETDIRALEALYEAAGGSEWQSDEGWLDGAALGGWYGVDADSLGRVTELDLADNDLAGVLPTGMGDLEELRTLKIERNSGLGGRLPLSLARLSALDVLKYARTELCAPVDKAFREWLDGLETHVGTGVDCDALTDRDMLVALYKATGGDSWKQNTNWLTDASLQDWFGVSVDTLERVTRLRLYGNDLTGPIPAELGNLASLRYLYLNANSLTGPVPPELGGLDSLEYLSLGSNRLTGEIPPELGDLAALELLHLDNNRLTGEIPPELGDLAALQWLSPRATTA